MLGPSSLGASKSMHASDEPDAGERDRPVTRQYHRLFLKMALVALCFAIVAGSVGIVVVLRNPGHVAAVGIIEGISALAFIYSHWTMRSYHTFLREAAYDDMAHFLMSMRQATENPDVFLRMCGTILASREPLGRPIGERLLGQQINDF